MDPVVVGGAMTAAIVAGPPLAGISAAVPATGPVRLSQGWWHGAPGPAWRTLVLTVAGCATTGLVALAAPATPMSFAVFALAIAAPSLAAADCVRHRLPDRLTVPLAAVVIICGLGSWPISGTAANLARLLVAGAVTAALLGGAALVARGGFGLGDAKLAAVLAALLAWSGWAYLAIGAAAAIMLAGLWALVTLIAPGGHRHTPVPVGPSLLGGALLALISTR